MAIVAAKTIRSFHPQSPLDNCYEYGVHSFCTAALPILAQHECTAALSILAQHECTASLVKGSPVEEACNKSVRSAYFARKGGWSNEITVKPTTASLFLPSCCGNLHHASFELHILLLQVALNDSLQEDFDII